MEGGKGQKDRKEHPLAHHILWSSFFVCCLCREPKAGRYFTKVREGKRIWTSSKQLSLKTTDGNREIWGSTNSQ